MVYTLNEKKHAMKIWVHNVLTHLFILCVEPVFIHIYNIYHVF